MHGIEKLFENNRAWAKSITGRDPAFFERLCAQQSPQYLWIGCSDSRVPANEIVGLLPGEIFVHRNIANLVIHTDFNCLSVIEYAVEVLKVTDIIVCGHYGCGGVMAALRDESLGLLDNWLCHIRDIYAKHQPKFASVDGENRANLLCELNVAEQVVNVCRTSSVQRAWARGREVCVHGVIYDLRDGLLKELGLHAQRITDLDPAYRLAVSR
jgi:carbonic anhydrase